MAPSPQNNIEEYFVSLVCQDGDGDDVTALYFRFVCPYPYVHIWCDYNH